MCVPNAAFKMSPGPRCNGVTGILVHLPACDRGECRQQRLSSSCHDRSENCRKSMQPVAPNGSLPLQFAPRPRSIARRRVRSDRTSGVAVLGGSRSYLIRDSLGCC
jgi:hypothetical protein